MKRADRHTAIIELLQKEHEVRVSDLSKTLGTAEMTIRRDLNMLTKEYNITRTHGGAKLESPSLIKIISFDEARIKNKEEKNVIAMNSAHKIKDGQRIFIDAGSTTRKLVDYLDPEHRNIIVANHLGIATKASELPNASVIILGGEVINATKCSSGFVTEDQISRYKFDAAFIGAAAVGNDGKIYDGYSPEASLKNLLFDLCDAVYLLVDSSKFNKYDIHPFGDLSKITEVFTDTNITTEGLQLLKKFNTEYTLCE